MEEGIDARVFCNPTKLGGATSDRSKGVARRAQELIPGGAHTYAKAEDQFPENAPPFIVRGKGCHVWDADGNEFIEYNMGLRAVTLGHAYEPVCRAVVEQLQYGSNFSRPAPIELQCAEAFLESVPTADMVKFCKDGSTAVDAAIRIARAHTGADLVVRCGDYSFFSTGDWFIGSTGMPAGVPAWIRDSSLKFPYNDLESAHNLFQAHPKRIACVVLEAARTVEPSPNFLPELSALCHQNGALLVFDEMITGFRWHRSGAQHVYGVTPDLSAFGKALANGFSVSAIAGRREFMRLGGPDHDRERVFLLSTTHGAETHAMAAAIATMAVYRERDVIGELHRQGRRLRAGIDRIVGGLGLHGYFQCIGRDCCLLYTTNNEAGLPSHEFRTLFLQETIRRGIIAPGFAVSVSHSDEDIDLTIDVVGEVLRIYRRALTEGIGKFLAGRCVKPVFRRFA